MYIAFPISISLTHSTISARTAVSLTSSKSTKLTICHQHQQNHPKIRKSITFSTIMPSVGVTYAGEDSYAWLLFFILTAVICAPIILLCVFVVLIDFVKGQADYCKACQRSDHHGESLEELELRNQGIRERTHTLQTRLAESELRALEADESEGTKPQVTTTNATPEVTDPVIAKPEASTSAPKQYRKSRFIEHL